MEKPAIWGVVPAAGIGTRMGANVPKQYLRLGELTVLEHTLNKLVNMDELEGVVVALHPQDTTFARLAIASHPKIHTAVGGDERSQSVLSALNSLQKKLRLHDWALVHDAARPCTRIDAIKGLIAELQEHEVGGILGVAASDTLKRVNAESDIETTLSRDSVWQAQTPQMFRYGLLRDTLQQALAQNEAITDEASALEWGGYTPKMVSGHRDNIKITHAEDLVIAQFLLQQQAKQNKEKQA